MDSILTILIALLLVIGNGFYAMSELALISVRRSVLQTFIDGDKPDHARRAELVAEMTADTDHLLATIQVAITLLSLGASAVSAVGFAVPLAAWLDSFGLAFLTAVSGPLSVIAITLGVSYVSLVVGELVPKRIALSNPELTAIRIIGLVRLTERLSRPLVVLLSASTNLIARAFSIKSPEDRLAVSEDDIKYLVTEQADLLDEEKRMIHEIFDLGDTVAREVMQPRVDMICIEDDATVGSTISRMRGTGFSRLPVINETPDRIIGVVRLKDLLSPLADGRLDDAVTDYLSEAFFIPETKDILPLLSEMQATHQQIAIVVDEYGGTAGVITIEDILEEIVGEISDEYDPDNKYQAQLADNEWLIDGRLSVDDARDLGFPVEDEDDYETIAGWLLDTIDGVPQIGDSFEIGSFTFKVQNMRRNRVSLLRVTKNPENDEELGLPL